MGAPGNSPIQTSVAIGDDERVAPFVPSALPVVKRMLELAKVGPGDNVFDLGSGDGRIVIMAAEKFGAEAVGVEIDDRLVKQSSARIARLGLQQRARIIHESMFRSNLRSATVVTLYQLTGVNARLREVFERQLRPGTRVVSHDFPISGWKPQTLVTGVLEDGSPHAIYLYLVGHLKEGIMPIVTDKRAYAAGRYGLELDGLMSGFVDSAEGGYATSEVVVEKIGPDRIAHKHIAGVKYEDITITCGTGMSKALYELIKESLDRSVTRYDGGIIEYDYNYKERSRLSFFKALVTEIGFPALDASSKDAAKMTVKFTPEYTRSQAGGAKLISAHYDIGQQKQKKWLASNFRLQISGLDCTRVSRVEAITVKQKVVENPAGESRDYEVEPASLDVPNLVVTLPGSSAKDFYDWHESFVIKGYNGQDQEKAGTLEYLTPDLKETLFTLELKHLGIFRLAPEKVAAGRENIRRVQAEMYCEEIAFTYGAGVFAASELKQSAAPTTIQTLTAPTSPTITFPPIEQVPRLRPSLRFRM